MTTSTLFHLVTRCALGASLALSAAAHAQAPAPATAPSSQQIIDALKGGKTRGMRNLGVSEAPVAPAAAAPAPAPSAPTAAPASAAQAPAIAVQAPASAVQAPAIAVQAPASATPSPAPVKPVAAPARPAATAVAEPVWPVKPASIDLAIQFGFNSNQILPESQKMLEQLAQALISPDLAGMRFLIEGHTDGKGLASYNQKLSQLRAEQVKRILVKYKVAPARLVAEGKGSSEPLNANNIEAPENRRVRITSLEH